MTLKAFVLGALFLIMPFSVSAQETPPPAPALVVANINISDVTILSSAPDGILRVVSTITNNGTETQSDIRIGLDIIKKTDKGQTIVDSMVSKQTLSLAPRESLQQELQYPAQSSLSGEYEVWVISKTTGGVMLGLNMAGKTTFLSAGPSVGIVPESCVLKVAGDEKSYTLRQGVDVAAEETLSFSCTLENHAATAVTVVPFFDTYRRSMYGERMDVAYPIAEAITLAANEKKEVSFVIPKATDPQAYDVSIVLKDQSSQTQVSNKVVAHYVLRGVSATIQSLLLDQPSYTQGSPLSARLFWTPSADQFPDSRAGAGTTLPTVIVKMTISDGNGRACIEPLEKKIETTDANPLVLETTTTAACVAPQVSVSLLDEGGNILDTRTFSSALSRGQEAPDSLSASLIPAPILSDMQLFILVIIILLFLISLLFIGRKFITSKRKFPTTGILRSFLFLILLSSGVFMGVGEAKALTFTSGTAYDVYSGEALWSGTNMFTINTNKSTYTPGETINLSMSVFLAACTNQGHITPMTAALNGTTATFLDGNLMDSEGNFFMQNTTLYDTRYLTAPSVPGTYNIAVTGCDVQTGYTYLNWWMSSICHSDSIPITVAGAPVNGACNNSTPNSCAAGTLGANAIQPDGSYHWYCNGANGGANSSLCYYAPPAPSTATLTASPASIISGGSSALSWTSTNATSCWAQGGGIDGWKAVNGGQPVSPAATTTYTIECWSSAGISSGQKSATVMVSAPAAPLAPTVTINASPASITSGGSSNLTWTSTNATSCWANSGGTFAGWKAVNGNQSVYPTVTTTYTMECWNNASVSSGQKSATVMVGAAAQPVAGGWSAWSSCSTTACGTTGTRSRSCTNPPPSGGGASCSGSSSPQSCTNLPCCITNCSATADNYCSGQSFTATDSCGTSETCTGTRSCDFNWKEVAP